MVHGTPNSEEHIACIQVLVLLEDATHGLPGTPFIRISGTLTNNEINVG